MYNINIIISIVFAWSIYGLGSIGHDALHNAFTKNKFIDRIIGFIFIDILMFGTLNSHEWNKHHNIIHHTKPNSIEDSMKIIGNIFVDYKNMLCGNNYYKKSWSNYINALPLCYLLLRIDVVNTIIIIFFIVFFLMYFTYITHCKKVIKYFRKQSINIEETSFVNNQLLNTLDIYPDSWFMSLLFGGINAHAIHHVYPSLTRHEILYNKSYYNKIKTNKYYIKIDNVYDLLILFKLAIV